MPRIYADFNELQEMSKTCDTLSFKLNKIEADLQKTVRHLDWDVRSSSEINTLARKLAMKLQEHSQILKTYQVYVDLVHRTYAQLYSTEVDLKVKEGRTDIFDGSNGYGGDQGDMSYRRNGIKILWWVSGEDEEIYDFIRTQEGYEDYSETQIHDLLDKINREGCGYVALVNSLFWEFNGTEEEFEAIFGFPMRDQDGNYNYNRMLIDLYCKTDDKYFLTEDQGKTALVIDVLKRYSDNPEQFEQDYGVPYDPESHGITSEIINAILSRYNEDTVTYESHGTSPYSQENRLIGYLHEKGINADVYGSNSADISVNEVRNLVDFGTVVKLSLDEGTQLCDANGNVIQTLDGGHAVIVTGVTDDGRYIISSWGDEYYIDPGGECNINSYLTLDIVYK